MSRSIRWTRPNSPKSPAGAACRRCWTASSAAKAGLRVKINAVALKGFNEDELFPLVDWCAREGHDLTFIEVMPMGEDDREPA
jgi:molybdenum cofactor biosynthesis enzyme MoaA